MAIARTRAPRRAGAAAGRQEPPRPPVRPAPDAVLDEIQNRILWLAVRMIHEANAVRPSLDGLKVGGHQASSASAVSILAALYLRWLRPADLVSVKPHASPAYHAIRYLLGDLERGWLTRLRAFGGLQSYPSRTKDPVRVDFSTGSVGLGAVAPLFASLADRYVRAHFPDGPGAAAPPRRFVALVGDAELDEGNVWEAVLEDALTGLGNVTMIVDLNRQSLDRVVPGIRIRRLDGIFRAAGWHVVEAKYGRRLEGLFGRSQGDRLRRRIDDMSNEEYQVLIRRPGPEARERLVAGVPAKDRDGLAGVIRDMSDDELPDVLADLGGHDVEALVRALDEADGEPSRPTVVFAYTIKGWRLPFAGDALNHSASMAAEQVSALGERLGADPDDPWAAFDPASPPGRLCGERGRYLRGVDDVPRGDRARAITVPERVESRVAAKTSTQQAFGDALAALARDPALRPRLVTAAPDVAVSTNLGGWINRVGVFAAEEAPVVDDTPRLLTWAPKPAGQHVELGISEMNLFMWLGQFGLSAELLGEPLVPIGTVYDPFICRGLDALIYGLYVRSRFILVATPSGITLAPEGGAHQSTITPSIGVELPGLRAWEPAFGAEVGWSLIEGIRGCADPSDGFSTYLRLSTRPVDQALAEPVRARLGETEWRRQAIRGGYRLLEARELDSALPADAPVVNVVAMGATVPEARAAVHRLVAEEVAANLIVVTSPDRLAAELHDRQLAAIRGGTQASLDHLESLLPAAERHAPIVTVLDGASHALTFLGGAWGSRVVPLGVDAFGQSGTIPDLYADAGIDADHIVEAALLALDEPPGR